MGCYLSEVFADKPEQAWLEIVGMQPKMRGRGLGTALAAHALCAYQQAGFESAWLG